MKDRQSLQFDQHEDKELKRDKAFFREVIQKNGLFLKDCPKPMFNADMEECGKFVYLGICNNKCPRNASHCLPTGTRKSNLRKFKEDCLSRYKASKHSGAPDFQ